MQQAEVVFDQGEERPNAVCVFGGLLEVGAVGGVGLDAALLATVDWMTHGVGWLLGQCSTDSVVVTELGEAGERLISVGVGVGASDPDCFHGDGVVQSHGLGGVLSVASCPDDLAGSEFGCHGEDHRSVW